MPVNTGSPRTRALAGALRRAREKDGRTLRALAPSVGFSHALLSFWETGRRIPKVEDVATLLAALGVTGEERETILDLARNASDSEWLASGSNGVNQGMAGLHDCERDAVAITDWSPLVIPGLLQTSDYARAVLSVGIPPRELESRVMWRLGRRDVLMRRNPVELTAFIGEAALRQCIGGADVMVDQLRYVARWAASDNVNVLAVPLGEGWHPGLAGPFVFYRFDESPAIVHIEHHRASAFIYDAEDVEAYQDAAEQIRREAMSPAATAGLIAEIADKMENTG